MTCKLAVGSVVAHACGTSVSSVAVDLVAQGSDPCTQDMGHQHSVCFHPYQKLAVVIKVLLQLGMSHRGGAHVLKELNKLFVRVGLWCFGVTLQKSQTWLW
mmetsp:Transcript_40321/g.106956  ORF Transcript_40321/g.106956 Transcript_40321/m.106956 type:complete len:101 (+) Transcript_40321:664-966(+)